MSPETLAGQPILVDRPQADICVITLNRPERLNALTRETVAQLNGVLDAIAVDHACRAVILTGAGRGFCSGQDMQAVHSRNQSGDTGVMEKLHWQEQFAGMGQRMRSMPQFVLAAVNGAAVGAGMALALNADVRLASRSAKFLVASVRIGLTGGESGLSYLLPRMIGVARAFDILLTGRPILAEEAHDWGMVTALAEAETLLDAALSYVRQVLGNSPYAVAQTKKLVWENLDAASFATALAAENRAQILGTATRDYREAAAAFTEKRSPVFEGR